MPCSQANRFVSFSSTQVFLVSGASSGLGQAIALMLNALGATVVTNGRDIKKLQNLKKLAQFPDSIHLEPLDLTADMEALPSWVNSLRKVYGKFTGFVHSAGLGLVAPLQNYDYLHTQKLLDIHLHAPMLITKGLADRRNNIGAGTSLVYISSISAVIPLKAKIAYSAAKSAMQTAAFCAAKELSSQGIRINCISPALIDTPMGMGWENFMGEAYAEKDRSAYPLGVGKPSDIANTACFLLSDNARWITGQNIVVDGGRY